MRPFHDAVKTFKINITIQAAGVIFDTIVSFWQSPVDTSGLVVAHVVLVLEDLYVFMGFHVAY